MTFKQNLGCLYFILPFIFSVDNKFGLAFSILIGSSTLKVKIQNQIILFHKSRFTTLLYLLGCLTYAYSYLLDSKKTLKISFDANNEFEISLQNLTLENRNLIELLYFGNKYGANFYTKNIFPPLDSYWKIIKYFYTFVFYSFASLFKFILFDDWSDLFLINEFSKSLYVTIQKDNFAKSYIFNISNVLSRPLWSYQLEKDQSQIYLLWYSANSISEHPNWPVNIIDWPINCVIHNEMKEFLKSNMYNYKTIQVVDPIWLEDSLKRIPSSSKKIIALFDIPVRKEYLRILY